MTRALCKGPYGAMCGEMSCWQPFLLRAQPIQNHMPQTLVKNGNTFAYMCLLVTCWCHMSNPSTGPAITSGAGNRSLSLEWTCCKSSQLLWNVACLPRSLTGFANTDILQEKTSTCFNEGIIERPYPLAQMEGPRRAWKGSLPKSIQYDSLGSVGKVNSKRYGLRA